MWIIRLYLSEYLYYRNYLSSNYWSKIKHYKIIRYIYATYIDLNDTINKYFIY